LPSRKPTFRAWLPALLLALAVASAVFFAEALSSPAYAQEQMIRPWNLFDLFLPRRERYYEPPPVQRVPVPHHQPKPKARAAKKSPGTKATAVPHEPEVAAVEKARDAKVVLVVGDFLGSGLAEGLSAVYAQNPKVRVIDRSKGSSGFVRDEHFDWGKEIGPLIEAEKPAAVVVMLGSNDRQRMRVGATSETLRTDNWTKEYTRRTDEMAKAIAARNVPFVWVGMPAFRLSKMTADMLAFNDIYRAASEGAGGEFVDVWDGFVDENGAFVTMGPNVNGQPERLRAEDGINFTKAGKRKLAFYAEKPLRKMLGVAAEPGEALAPGVFAPAPGADKAKPVDRTPPVSLSDPALDGGGELLGAQAQTRQAPRSPNEKLMKQGIAPDRQPGRADDFAAPAGSPTPAAGAPAPVPPPAAGR